MVDNPRNVPDEDNPIKNPIGGNIKIADRELEIKYEHLTDKIYFELKSQAKYYKFRANIALFSMLLIIAVGFIAIIYANQFTNKLKASIGGKEDSVLLNNNIITIKRPLTDTIIKTNIKIDTLTVKVPEYYKVSVLPKISKNIIKEWMDSLRRYKGPNITYLEFSGQIDTSDLIKLNYIIYKHNALK